jgi:hypothetical protein
MMPRVVEVLIVGGGPAGSAVLLAAARSGALAGLAKAGLVIAESGPRLGAGGIGRYTINSDSTAGTFLSSVVGHPDARVAAVAHSEVGRAVAALPADGPVRLRLAASLLDELGAALHETAEAAGALVLTGHAVLGLQREQHLWIARVQQGDAPPFGIAARQVVIATGGAQTASQVAAIPTVSGPLGARCGARLMRADALMAEGGVAELCERVRGVARPMVAVLGGSTSALASVRVVLESPVAARMATGALSLVHRRRLRPFYRSAEAARADGFTDFGPQDICPVSGFVFRLGGLRLDAREIVLSALRIGGRQPDPRLRLVRPAESVRGIRALDEAHVVVAATGYRPRALPVADANGTPIGLYAGGRGAPPMVDGACRVLDWQGIPLPNLFAIGLAAGFVPHGRLGGEASFSGQANGLWLWQHDVGTMIVEQIRRHAEHANRQVA